MSKLINLMTEATGRSYCDDTLPLPCECTLIIIVIPDTFSKSERRNVKKIAATSKKGIAR